MLSAEGPDSPTGPGTTVPSTEEESEFFFLLLNNKHFPFCTTTLFVSGAVLLPLATSLDCHNIDDGGLITFSHF